MKVRLNLHPHIGWVVGGVLFWGTVIYLVSLLVGCAGPMIFAKPGATEQQLAADGYDCDVQWDRSSQGIAFRQDPIGNAYYGLTVRDDKTRCMARKGWVRTDK